MLLNVLLATNGAIAAEIPLRRHTHVSTFLR